MSDAGTIVDLLTHRDVNAARQLLNRGGPAEIMRRYNQVSSDIYWKHKHLPLCIEVIKAGLHAAENFISASPATAADLRGQMKALYYNLASFTWIGWDEPGIHITAAQQATGYDAAEANLRLAQELEKGPLALSRAYWMNAGHVLAARQRPAARALYELAREQATLAKAPAEALLAEAFIDIARRHDWRRLRDRLLAEKDGVEFVRQCATAERVFNERTPAV